MEKHSRKLKKMEQTRQQEEDQIRKAYSPSKRKRLSPNKAGRDNVKEEDPTTKFMDQFDLIVGKYDVMNLSSFRDWLNTISSQNFISEREM